MKIFILLFFFLFTTLFSQTINVNPDPRGEPWLAGGVPPLNEEGEKRLKEMRRFKLSGSLRSRPLPVSVDNSQNKFFRPIFNQVGNSCAQASGIGYIYTYEVGRIKDRDVKNNSEYWFPSHYTWHFINEGKNYGSWPYQGWDIVEKTGCPLYNDFGGMDGGDATMTLWMDGYDGYKNGMAIVVREQIILDNMDTEAGLNQVKQYLYDYGNGSSAGGLVSFSAHSSGYESKDAVNMENQGEMVITKWGTGGAHMMTFVGYNDNIKVDLNNDGQYTNDKDINGDGKVTIRDWEIGAFKVANSWGDSWGNNGFCWQLYSVIGYGEEDKYDAQYNGGIDRNQVYAITVNDNAAVEQTVKFKLDYNDRFKLTLIAGVAQNTSASSPDFTDTLPIAAIASDGGGTVLPMQGKNMPEPIEMGYNVSKLISNINSSQDYKFFFTLVRGASAGKGTLRKVGLIDYSDGGKEYYWAGSEKNLDGSGNSTVTLIKDGIGTGHEMDEPLLKDLKFVQALTSTVMTLEALIEDESELSSVIAKIELKNGNTEDVTFSKKSKDGINHLYTATLNAQNAPVKGDISFTLIDEHDNKNNTYPKQIEWADQFTIQYENAFSDGLGNASGDEYTPAIKLTSDELTPFYGKGKLSAVKFFLDREVAPGYMEKFEVKVFNGAGNTPENEIYSFDVKGTLKYEDWNTHILSEALSLEEGKNYWIGYHIKFGYGWFCALEESTPINGKTNVIKYNGNWTTLSDLGWNMDGRWNIRAVIESSEAAEKPKMLSLKGGRAKINDKMILEVEAMDNKGLSSMEAVYYKGGKGPFTVSMSKEGSGNSKMGTFTGELEGLGYSCEGRVSFKIRDTDNNLTTTSSERILWISDNELHYDDEYNRNIGNPSGDIYQPTIRLTSKELSTYENTHSISGVRFYLNLDNEESVTEINKLEIKIYKSSPSDVNPSEVLYSYDYTDDIVADGWQDHILASFVKIEKGYDYWIAYNIDFNSGYFTGYSETDSQNENGCVVLLRNSAWESLVDWGFNDAHWNLRALIESNQVVSNNSFSSANYKFMINSVLKNYSFIKFNFSLPSKENVEFELINPRGQIVRTVKFAKMEKGNNIITLERNNLADGFYIYRIKSGKRLLKGTLILR